MRMGVTLSHLFRVHIPCTMQMLGLDDFEVVADTLDSVFSEDSFQFLTGVVNRNSEMKMFLFSCK